MPSLNFMKFFEKVSSIEATQWFKNGDHPKDDVFRPFEDTGAVPTEPREGKVVRRFRDPNYEDASECTHCGCVMQEHGWIDQGKDGTIVHPSDYIITRGESFEVLSESDFTSRFLPQSQAIEVNPDNEVHEYTGKIRWDEIPAEWRDVIQWDRGTVSTVFPDGRTIEVHTDSKDNGIFVRLTRKLPNGKTAELDLRFSEASADVLRFMIGKALKGRNQPYSVT